MNAIVAFFTSLSMFAALLPVAEAQRGVAPDARSAGMDFPKLGQEVVAIVRDHFLDPRRGAEWARRHDHYARGIEDQRVFAERTRELLGELKTSHTAYFTPLAPEYAQLLAIFQRPLKVDTVWHDSIGADIARLPSGFFVRHLFADGPAEKAGLLRGDQLLSADDKPFDPSLAFRGKSGRTVALTVERRKDEAPRVVRVTPRRVQPREEWLEAQRRGARIVTRNGKRIAYMPVFSCAGMEPQEVIQEMIAEKFEGADALIVDFRDGWGGCNPEFLNLFHAAVPVLTQVDRDGKRTSYDRVWRKPLYVLINGGSRSGKEMVAHAIKKHHRGTLVGERTAGAVVGGRAFLLSDRSLLYLAVTDVLVDGERLEGRGVEPDVRVADVLPHAAGSDPQRERALDLAAGRR
jgi:carboxyl-terminal processing protease